MRIGEKIKKLREERKMTQQDLADRIGKSRAAIGKYETGVRLPDNATLHAICDFFEVTTDYLLGRSERRQVGQEIALEECLSQGMTVTFSGRVLTEEEKALYLSVLRTLQAGMSPEREEKA